MIQVGTTLVISDNSGAKKAKCIKILKKNKKHHGPNRGFTRGEPARN